MDAEDDRSLFWRIKRYQEIQDTQARGVRKRFLISGFVGRTICGAYVGVGSSVDRYPSPQEPGDGAQRVKHRRSGGGPTPRLGALLDEPASRPRLPQRSFGPFVIDAAVRTHVPELMGADGAAPFAWPAPEVAPGAIAEEELRRRLSGSEKRKLTGRG